MTGGCTPTSKKGDKVPPPLFIFGQYRSLVGVFIFPSLKLVTRHILVTNKMPRGSMTATPDSNKKNFFEGVVMLISRMGIKGGLLESRK